jgi:hypothetical protein
VNVTLDILSCFIYPNIHNETGIPLGLYITIVRLFPWFGKVGQKLLMSKLTCLEMAFGLPVRSSPKSEDGLGSFEINSPFQGQY